MSYKKEASKAHKSKLRGYADGGGIEESPSLLDQVSDLTTKKLAAQEGEGAEEQPMEPSEI